MNPRDRWVLRLWMRAPGADWTLLRIVAAVLASDGGPELLLIVGDALTEGSTEALFYGRDRDHAAFEALAEVVYGEASLRTAPLLQLRPRQA